MEKIIVIRPADNLTTVAAQRAVDAAREAGNYQSNAETAAAEALGAKEAADGSANDAALSAAIAETYYTGPSVADVPALQANTALSYTPGPGVVTAGQPVTIGKEGFSYVVADPAATDATLQTAGGVKVYAQPLQDGAMAVELFRINSVEPDASVFSRAAQIAVPQRRAVVLRDRREYQVDAKITHTAGTDAGSYGFNPTFMLKSEGRSTIRTALTTGNLLEVPGWGGTPGRQYHWASVENIDFRGPGTRNAAVSFIATANCRMPKVRNCTFAGSPGGHAIDAYSRAAGGSYGGIVEGCHFGYQAQQSVTDPDTGENFNCRNLVTQLWPSIVGSALRMRGPGNSSGKVNDWVFRENIVYGTLAGSTIQGWHTAYEGSGLYTGGSGNFRSFANVFVQSQTRDVEEKRPVLNSTTNSVNIRRIPGDINVTSGDYLGFIVKVVSGPGVGQSREILDDTVFASVRTLTVAPWTVQPTTASVVRIIAATPALIAEYGVGNLPFTHFYDHGYGWESFMDYFEESNAYVLAGMNALDNFILDAAIQKVSDGQYMKRVDGTGISPRFGRGIGSGFNDAMPSHSVIYGIAAVKGSGTGSSNISGQTKAYANYSGAAVATGDVCRRLTSGSFRVALTTGTNQDCPVVIYCPAGKTYADLTDAPVALSGSDVPVKVTGTVVRNDTLVPSATPGVAMVNNAITDPKKIIGYALTPDISGVALAKIS